MRDQMRFYEPMLKRALSRMAKQGLLRKAHMASRRRGGVRYALPEAYKEADRRRDAQRSRYAA